MKKYGFTAYRGKGNEWYNSVKSRRLHQICHLADEFLRIGPGTSLPYIDEYGLCNTAGNMLYLSRSGFRRLIPVSSRVRKAIKGIDRAIDRGDLSFVVPPANTSDRMASLAWINLCLCAPKIDYEEWIIAP